MKKLCIVVLILAGLAYFGLLPFEAHDVAELLPVETVLITKAGDAYRVDIGAGVRAVGRTLREALDRLKEEVTGFVFFQTAEQVIVREDALDVLPEAESEPRFRPAAGLYRTDLTDPDLSAVSRYLKTRHTGLTLGRALAETGVEAPLLPPKLVQTDGGYRVVS